MKNKNLPAGRRGKKILVFLFSLLLSAGFFGFTVTSTAKDTSVVINEVQIAGESPDDDFIELYNPGCKDLDISGWKLRKRTKSGTESSIKVTSKGKIIKAKGYFLWVNSKGTLSEKVEPDETSQVILSENYSIALLDASGEIIDSLTWGASDKPFDNSFLFPANPEKNQSLKRKNNDFEISNSPSPQNSDEIIEEELKKCITKPPLSVVYSDKIRINELLPNSSGDENTDEFIELYNFSSELIALENWQLKDKSGKTYTFPKINVAGGDYLAVYSKDSKIALNNSGLEDVSLLNPDDEVVFYISYTDADRMDFSYSFETDDTWQWTFPPTPREKNRFDEPVPPEDQIDNNISTCNGSICLNEILPNPKGDEKTGEFVEIYNAEDSIIDLAGWTLKDSSKTKYTFPTDAKIEPGKYSVIYRTDFKFAMNNSGHETIYLLDKSGKTASLVSYNGAKENVSYNFDGAFWHWSRFLTPKKENRFNHAPKVKIKKNKEAFAGVPVAFEASVKDKDKDKVKYIWDFGDGHKSYLKNPTHIYLKRKKYTVTFTVDDGSEKFAKTISMQVKSYPKADIKIVQLSPNPAGNDMGKEKIVLLNNSKKKINLKGWKIATGSKKLINHLIANDFLIEPGKTASITRQNAFFYLNNTVMKLELRYPNGKTADKVAYQKEKINENEIYKKTNGQWAWIAPEAENKLALAENLVENNPVLADNQEIQNNLGKYSTDPQWQKKKENAIVLASYATNLSLPKDFSNQPRVLGASTIQNDSDYFSFGRPYVPEPHWAVKFVNSLGSKINQLLNKLIGYF